MDNINSVLSIVTPGCFMASVDLKDAYFSVKVHEFYQSFLKFSFEGGLYQYTCFPNGLGPCSRKFTKLNKFPLSHLRNLGHLVVGYIDDFFLKGDTFNECNESVLAFIYVFDEVGRNSPWQI